MVLWPQLGGGGVGHFVVGTTQKYHFFLTPLLSVFFYKRNRNPEVGIYKRKQERGGVKKVVLLGGAHHKVAYPPLVVVKVPIFCGKFFICLESPDTEK